MGGERSIPNGEYIPVAGLEALAQAEAREVEKHFPRPSRFYRSVGRGYPVCGFLAPANGDFLSRQ